MILYQSKFRIKNLSLNVTEDPAHWYQYVSSSPIQPDDFHLNNFKIGDVMYTEYSDEFKKVLLWEELTT